MDLESGRYLASPLPQSSLPMPQHTRCCRLCSEALTRHHQDTRTRLAASFRHAAQRVCLWCTQAPVDAA
jgi:hypothetical protein